MGGRCDPGGETSFIWTDPDEASQSSESIGETWNEVGTDLESDPIDLEFEWYQLCHGCGERKWFASMICDECRDRHAV